MIIIKTIINWRNVALISLGVALGIFLAGKLDIFPCDNITIEKQKVKGRNNTVDFDNNLNQQK